MITERHRALWEGYQAVKVTYDLVASDRRHCQRLLKERLERHASGVPAENDEDGFLIRSLVRTYFSEIEGLSGALRDALLQFAVNGTYSLTVPEQVVLREEVYVLRGSKIETQRRNNKFLDNLQFRVNLFYKAFGVEAAIDTSDARWNSFRRSVEIRNEITHPKNLEQYRLPPEAGEDLKCAIGWFTQEISKVFGSCLAVLESAIPGQEEGAEWNRA